MGKVREADREVFHLRIKCGLTVISNRQEVCSECSFLAG